MKKKKILFVAPFAHYDGHHCYAACSEAEALASAGEEVVLLTFNGLIDNSYLVTMKTRNLISLERRQIINRMNSHEVTKWPFMFVTAVMTLAAAVMIYGKEKFDLIQLRDSDSFPFLPWLIGLISNETRWIVSMLSTLERVPFVGPISRLPLWGIVNKTSVADDNRYLYVCQNEDVLNYYSNEFLGGILSGMVFELPPMISTPISRIENISNLEARNRLDLPLDKTIFLSFGSVHRGKDPETIFAAVESIPNSFCLHAGKTTLNMVPAFEQMKKRYKSNVSFCDRYIAENEKAYYFAASAAVILSYTKDFKATSSMLWEACRYRVPIIASDSSQLGHFVRLYDLGLTFQSQNSASLREAILAFMNFDNERIQTIKRNCDRFCNDFSSEKWVSKCEELYLKLEYA